MSTVRERPVSGVMLTAAPCNLGIDNLGPGGRNICQHVLDMMTSCDGVDP